MTKEAVIDLYTKVSNAIAKCKEEQKRFDAKNDLDWEVPPRSIRDEMLRLTEEEESALLIDELARMSEDEYEELKNSVFDL
jgi:hypothetical protein